MLNYIDSRLRINIDFTLSLHQKMDIDSIKECEC